ncbi:hypothetical protein K492DRAFT_176123 [Lichtheimia hyalospora FSU 10163]|nr:hypothetical protein K492DRAFT_176123 [Lichtheimia hyalospora FSU 10163]
MNALPNASAVPKSESPDASSKRIRISRACDFCRRKKVKCHFTPGTPCSNCVSYGVACEFTDNAKKRGPPKGFIDGLEKRIRRIESILAAGGAGDESYPSSSSSSSLQQQQQPPFIAPRKGHVRSKAPSAKHIRCVGDTSMLLLLQKKLSIGRISELMNHIAPGPDFRQYGRELVQVLDDQVSMSQLFPDAMHLQRGVNFWIYTTTGADRHTSDRLLQIYFLNIHPVLPVVDKVEFLRQYRDQADNFPAAELMNAMFGAAARFVEYETQHSETMVKPEARWDVPSGWSDHFFDQVESFLRNNPGNSSLSTAQAMILLINTTSKMTAKSSASWLMNGLVIRLGQALGLHRCCSEWQISNAEKELRRRIWWGMFIGDRFQAAALGRPTSIREEDADVEYPSTAVSWREVLDEPLGPDDDAYPRFPSSTFRPVSLDGSVELYQLFLQLVKLSEILGRILLGMYTPGARRCSAVQGYDAIVTRLDYELTEWHQGFPISLKNTKHKDFDEKNGYFASSIASILLAYFSCLILLHRPFIERDVSASDEKTRSSYVSFRISTSAASRGVRIAERMTGRDFMMFPYLFNVYPILQFCLIHLYNARNPDVRISTAGRKDLRKALQFVERVKNISSRTKSLHDVVQLIMKNLGGDLQLSSSHSSPIGTSHHSPRREPVSTTVGVPRKVSDVGRGSNPPPSQSPIQQQQQLTPKHEPTTIPSDAFAIEQQSHASPSHSESSLSEAFTLKQFGFDAPMDNSSAAAFLQQQDMTSFTSTPLVGGSATSSLYPYPPVPDSTTPYPSSMMNTTAMQPPQQFYGMIPGQDTTTTVQSNFRNNPNNPFVSLPSSMDWSDWIQWMVQRGPSDNNGWQPYPSS